MPAAHCSHLLAEAVVGKLGSMPRELNIWPGVSSEMILGVLKDHCAAEKVSNLPAAFKEPH